MLSLIRPSRFALDNPAGGKTVYLERAGGGKFQPKERGCLMELTVGGSDRFLEKYAAALSFNGLSLSGRARLIGIERIEPLG